MSLSECHVISVDCVTPITITDNADDDDDNDGIESTTYDNHTAESNNKAKIK